MSTYPPGTRVTVNHPNHPGIYVVDRNGPKNAVVTPETGGRGLRVPHTMLSVAGADDPPPPPAQEVRIFELGQFVTLDDPRHPGVFVVIADKGDKINVARAGGGNGLRYVRAPRTMVSPAPVELTVMRPEATVTA